MPASRFHSLLFCYCADQIRRRFSDEEIAEWIESLKVPDNLKGILLLDD